MQVAAAREQLVRQGFRDALLCMTAGNRRADRFYRADESLPDGSAGNETVWNVTLHEVRYQRKLL